MFKKLALGCLLLIALVVGLGIYGVSKLPSTIDVSQSRVIDASTAEIHPLVEDFKRWPEWSYWEAEDSTLTYEYSGSEKGEGAIVSWLGKDGPGGMTATASDPDKGFWYDLSFGEGDQTMKSKGVIQYEAVEGGTRVSFEMRGELDGLLGKLMGAVVTPAVTIAFDANLANLAGLVEAK